jgi:hypothetical protein
MHCKPGVPLYCSCNEDDMATAIQIADKMALESKDTDPTAAKLEQCLLSISPTPGESAGGAGIY